MTTRIIQDASAMSPTIILIVEVDTACSMWSSLSAIQSINQSIRTTI